MIQEVIHNPDNLLPEMFNCLFDQPKLKPVLMLPYHQHFITGEFMINMQTSSVIFKVCAIVIGLINANFIFV